MTALVAYLAADLVVRTFPAHVVEHLARLLARAAFRLRGATRRQLEANLARLDGGAPDAARVTARARVSFEHFALSFADFLRLPSLGPELPERVEIHGGEHFRAAQASGRGVILLSAHIGNWEWGAAYIAASGTRIHVAAQPHRSRLVDAFFRRRRQACGVTALEDGPLWVSASRALRRNEWVALMGDRSAPGRTTSVCAWAAALSRRTGALLLPAVMLRLDDGRYAACFEPPLTPESCRNGGYLTALRRYLDRDPPQWFAFEPLPEGLA